MNVQRTVLITGASGRLGQLFLSRLEAKNTRILFSSRSQQTINALCEKYQGFSIFGKQADFLEKVDLEDFVKWVQQHSEGNLYLLNNARNKDNLKISEISRQPDKQQWLNEYYLDVVLPYELTMALSCQAVNLKAVINISSMYGVVVPNATLYDDYDLDSPIHYGVAKAALIHLSKELAVRLRTRNIRVNTLSLGGVEGNASEAFKQKYAKLAPSQRMVNAEELTSTLDFLLSEASIGLNGQNIVVDGGWTLW